MQPKRENESLYFIPNSVQDLNQNNYLDKLFSDEKYGVLKFDILTESIQQ